MRLWSISPEYLDVQGLLAVWREGLLAQKVLLEGEYKTCKYCKGDINYREDYPIQNMPCVICSGTGKIKTPYYNHSALNRFKETKDPLQKINCYLKEIWEEANRRGYNFNRAKIGDTEVYKYDKIMTVTTGQLEYEFNHLQDKLWKRNKKQFDINVYQIGNSLDKIEPHLLFKVVEGDIEGWEKIK